MGATYDLRWASTGSWPTVSLAYSTDLGATWTTIVAAAPNTGRFAWPVPATPTTRGLLRVSSTTEPFLSDTSDAAFTLATAPTTGTVIPEGATWKYLASGAAPAEGWALPSFDDAAWPSGPAELGYGDGDEATVLPRTSPSQPSVYFRHRFTLAGPVSGASVTVRYDDGVAIWLNGALVSSANVARGLAHTAYASASAENATLTTAIPASAFVVGENTVAVMVKQVGPTSPDLSFRLRLDVTGPGAGP